MKHYLYIIYSTSKNKYYVGETSDINERIIKHNTHYYDNSYTKIADDWKSVLNFQCENSENAIFLEKFIKKMKSTVFIKNLVENPNILTDILTKMK